MKRQSITCWFVRTALSERWYETADRRSTAPASARKSRKTSAAGEKPSLSFSAEHFSEPCFLNSLAFPGQIKYLHIFWVFIIWSSFNDFPCVSTGPSTFIGTTGNATCFPLTVSPMALRSSQMPTLLCTKKKVNMSIFRLTLWTCIYVVRGFRCRENRLFFQGSQVVRLASGFLRSSGFYWHNKSRQSPSPPAV